MPKKARGKIHHAGNAGLYTRLFELQNQHLPKKARFVVRRGVQLNALTRPLRANLGDAHLETSAIQRTCATARRTLGAGRFGMNVQQRVKTPKQRRIGR